MKASPVVVACIAAVAEVYFETDYDVIDADIEAD